MKNCPIKHLLPKVIRKFEMNKKLTEFAKTISNADGKLKFILNCTTNISVNVQNRTIYMGKPFLCFLWIVCYFVYVSYYEEIRKHLNEEKDIDENKLQKAEELWDWGRSLYYGYIDWPNDLPSPKETPDNEQLAAVDIFFGFAMEFIVAHEIGHVILGHNPNGDSQQELEADDFAIKVVLSELAIWPDSLSSLNTGVFMGLCATVLFDNNAEKSTLSHPCSFERLKTILDKLDIKDDYDPIWIMACFVLGVWDVSFNKQNDFPDKIISYRYYFEQTYQNITKKKRNYVS